MNKSTLLCTLALFLGACPNPPVTGDGNVANADGATIITLTDGARVLPDGALVPDDATTTTDTDVVVPPTDTPVVTNDADAGVPPTDVIVHVDVVTTNDGRRGAEAGASCNTTSECAEGLWCSQTTGCTVMPRCEDVQGRADAGAWALCNLPDGGIGHPDLPPGQAFDPWLRAPDGGILNGPLPDGGNPMDPPLDSVPWRAEHYENAYNDNWSWEVTSGSGMGTSRSTVMSAVITNDGMFGIGVPFIAGGMVWSVRDGVGYFWSKWSSMGIPGAEYCRGEWNMDGGEMRISCWRYPNNPLTTPGAPTSRTIHGTWNGDHPF